MNPRQSSRLAAPPHPSAGQVSDEVLDAIEAMHRATMPSQRMVNRRLEMEGPSSLPEKPWSGLFAGAKLASKGMPLGFVAPVLKVCNS